MIPKQQFTLADGAPLTRQENFVLRQVAAGEIADLKQEFGEAEEERRLRARFLEELLTGELKGVRVHRRGVRVRNAIIEERLDLENAVIPVAVAFVSFIFRESVIFRDACLKKYLLLNRSLFIKKADFHMVKVEINIFCRNTIFKGQVNFGGAIIAGQFDAEKAKFLAEEQGADFNGMQVGQIVSFDETEFHGPVDFCSAQIKGQFSSRGAKYLSDKEEVNFNSMQVGQHALFHGSDFHGLTAFSLIRIGESFDLTPLKKNGLQIHTTFRGAVSFGGASIKVQLAMQGARFLSEGHKIVFSGIEVGEDAIFNEVEFHGPVGFINANIKRQFLADGAKFLCHEHKTEFGRMQVGQDAFFRGCDFHGIVSFVGVKVAGDFNLTPLLKIGQEMSTTFHSDVNFHGAEIGGELLADKAQFLGHIVDFEAVRVGRSFHASGALFSGSVYFSEMQVKNNFYIDPFERMKSFKTLFKGAANFSRLEVGGVFNADQAIFQSDSVIFSGLKVGQGAFFNGTIFFGGLVLKEGQLTDLVIRGLHKLSKGGLPLDEIVLNRTRIAHRLTIEDLEVKKFDARNLEVKGPTELSRILIKDETDFRDAACHHLQMVEVDWPEPRDGRERVFLDGLNYESITTRKEPDKPEDWLKLLAWLGLGRFNTQNYQELDGFFQRGGLRKWADKVSIAGKRRELGKLKWWHPANWLTRFFWGLLAGYGRKPGRTLWISMGLIILGAFLLDPVKVLTPEFLNNLAGYQDNIVHSIALRLIVSLYSFVAAIPGWGSHLSLASPEFHIFVYFWFQRICGWILIPIGLAAVYTRLK